MSHLAESEGGGRVGASPASPCGQNGPKDISGAITVHRHEESPSAIDIDQQIGRDTRIATAMVEDPVPILADMDEVTKAHLRIAHVDRSAVKAVEMNNLYSTTRGLMA